MFRYYRRRWRSLNGYGKGFGKRTLLDTIQESCNRCVSIKVNDRNGDVVGAVQVKGHEIMLISNKGTLVRTPVEGVSSIGKYAV